MPDRRAREQNTRNKTELRFQKSPRNHLTWNMQSQLGLAKVDERGARNNALPENDQSSFLMTICVAFGYVFKSRFKKCLDVKLL
jgi:hypothetical protein